MQIFLASSVMFIVLKINDKWIMHKNSERSVKICESKGHFGEWVCNILPTYHSICACDTSYLSITGKSRGIYLLGC